MRFNDLMGDGWGAEVVTTPGGKLASHTYYFSLMAYERFFGDTEKKSCYIDSIILNGLIKCILNNTKLEKKREGGRQAGRQAGSSGTTAYVDTVLGRCSHSSHFVGNTNVISPCCCSCF